VAFLDEPTAGVDAHGRLAIRDVIADLRATGTCVLLTTHEMQEAERLADRIIIIDHGKIVADGTPAELVASQGGKGIRFGAPAGLDVGSLAGALGARVREERSGEYLVDAEPKPQTVAALTAWLAERDLPLGDLRAGRDRLEEVFLRLTADPVEAQAQEAPEAPPEPEHEPEPEAEPEPEPGEDLEYVELPFPAQTDPGGSFVQETEPEPEPRVEPEPKPEPKTEPAPDGERAMPRPPGLTPLRPPQIEAPSLGMLPPIPEPPGQGQGQGQGPGRRRRVASGGTGPAVSDPSLIHEFEDDE